MRTDIAKKHDITAIQLCSQSFNVSPPEIGKLNLNEIAQNLDQSYSIKSTERSVLVSLASGEKITLMSSGSAIIKGVDTAEDAIRLYKLILDKNS